MDKQDMHFTIALLKYLETSFHLDAVWVHTVVKQRDCSIHHFIMIMICTWFGD